MNELVLYAKLKKYTDAEIQKIQALSPLSYKGSVANYASLPTNASKGDLYTTSDDGKEYVWDGSNWIELGSNIDDLEKAVATNTENIEANTESIETNAKDIASEVTNRKNADIALTRRTRNNITSNLGNLCTAISEQNLEKYGYAIGDYFVGASGYYYYLADPDTYYGGYSNGAVIGTHHCGIVVDTKSASQWDSSGTATKYSASTLHTFLTGTALTNIQNDITALFGDYSSHLLANSMLDNAIGGWGDVWVGNTYIRALTEIQVYGSRVWSADNYQNGDGVKKLALFDKFRFNEIIGNTWFWLKSLYSASNACHATHNGYANAGGVASSGRAVGLILFH